MIVAGSPAGTFNRVASFSYFLIQGIPVVTLDFNYTVLNGSATTAPLFKRFRKFPEIVIRQSKSGDSRYAFPLASFCLPFDPHNAVTFLYGIFFSA